MLRINFLAVMCVGLLIACGPGAPGEELARSEGSSLGQVRAGVTATASLSFADQTRGTISASKTMSFSEPSNGSNRTCSLSIPNADPFWLIRTSDNARVKSLTTITLTKGNPALTRSVVFEPTAVGTANATLSVTCDGNGTNSDTVALSGTGLSSASVDLSTLTFEAQKTGTLSQTKPVVLSNSSTAFKITSISVVGDFEVTDPAVFPADVPAAVNGVNGTRTISVRFKPTPTGATTGSITINTDEQSSFPVTLNGTRVALATQVTPVTTTATPQTFSDQRVGVPSAPKTVTVRNAGDTPLAITAAFSSTEPFALVSPPTTPMAPGASQTLQVTFTPGTEGDFTDSLNLTTDEADPTDPSEDVSIPVHFSGKGVQPDLVLTPSGTPSGTVAFGEQRVTTEVPQTVKVSNNGTGPITISDITRSGSSAFSFTSSRNLSFTLAAGEDVDLTVKFLPTTEGDAAGTLTLVTDDPGYPSDFVINLSGKGVRPLLVLDSAFAFGDVRVGANSTKTVTLSNNGTGPITITNITKGGHAAFTLLNPPGTASSPGIPSTPTTPFTLAAGQSQAFAVKYSPNTPSTSTDTGTISLATSDLSYSPAYVIDLTGKGVRPVVVVDPNPLAFGEQRVTTEDTKTVTVRNDGNGPITITSITKSGSAAFTLISPPGTPFTIGAGAAQGLSVKFSPTTETPEAGTLTLASTDPDYTAGIAINLSGTGVNPALVLEPAPLAFNDLRVGTETTQTVTLRNNGTGTIYIKSIGITGHSAYSLVSPPATQFPLAAGATQPLTVKYKPTVESAAGTTDTATLTVSGGSFLGFAWTSATASLTGKGVKPNLVLSPSPLPFGDVRAGTESTKTLTVKNTGTGPITLSSITKSGSLFSLVSPPGTPLTLAPGAEQPLTVKFSPALESTTTEQGSVTVTSTDPDFPSLTANLTGKGVKPTLVLDPATPLAFGDVRLNTEDTKTLTLRNTGSGSLTITELAKSANPVFTLVSPPATPFTIAVGANKVLTVKFKPTVLQAPESATLTVVTSDSEVGSSVVQLSGRGVKPTLVLDPSTGLAFGEVRVGTNSTPKTVKVSNTGSGPITISSLSTGTSSPFTLVSPPATPFTIAAGTDTVLSVRFSPGTEASSSGALTLTTQDADFPSVAVSLSGQGIKPNLQLSPNPLPFGDVHVGDESTQLVMVSNTGTGPITLSGLSTGGSTIFTLVNPPAMPFTMEPNSNWMLSVKFNPAVEGSATGTLTVTSTDSEFASRTVTLNGKGVKPNLVFAPSPLAFGDVRVGTSSTKTVTVSNTGSGPITITNVIKTGETFTLETPPGTPFTLGAGDSTTLSVKFSPVTEATAPYTGTITLNTEDPGLPTVTLQFSGKGVKPHLALSPNPLAFGDVRVNTELTKPVTVSNTGSGPITISSFSTGTSSPFSLVSPPATPFTLAAGSNTVLTVKLIPTADAPVAGTLTVTSLDSDFASSSIDLTGRGVVPNLVVDPNPLVFDPQIAGTTSPARTVTVTNTGTGRVRINSMSITGGTPFSIVSSTAAVTLLAGESADIQVKFSPPSKGEFPATLTLSTDDAARPTVLVTLSGRGTSSLKVDPADLLVDFSEVPVGQEITRTVTLTNDSAAPITGLSLSSVASPFTVTSPGTTTLTTLGAATSFTVKFKPTSEQPISVLLTLESDASNRPHVFTLKGTGVVPVAKLSLPVDDAPPIASLDFAGVRVNATAQLTVRLTNIGKAPLSFNQRPSMASATDGGTSAFSYLGPDTMTLAPGTFIDFQVSFQPRARITYSDTLIIRSTATNSPTALSLTGIGADPELKLDRTSIFFGDVRVGSRSSEVPVTINNTGNAPVSLQNLPVSGPFEVILPKNSNGTTITLPKSIPVGTSFTFSVIFKPAAETEATGWVSVMSDMSNISTDGGTPELRVDLKGTGTTSLLATSVNALNFGGQRVRQTSGVLPVVLTNPGKAELEISQFVFSNNMFTIFAPLPLPTESAPLKIGAGQQKTISVTFTPNTLGDAQGQFFIISNAANATDAGTLGLSGKGIDGQLSLTPSVVSFDGDGGVEVGGGGAQQSVSIKNIGEATLTISGMDPLASGVFSVSGLPIGQSDAGVILQPNGEWPITVTFVPENRGFVSASAIIRSDSVISPAFNMLLKGTGVAPAVDLLPKDVFFGKSNVSVSTTQDISIKNVGERDLYVSNISFADVDAGSTDGGVSSAALDFSIGGGGADGGTGVSFPIIVAPGRSTLVPLKFTPREMGPRRARAIVYTNDKTVEANLQGEGASPNLAVSSLDLVLGVLDFKNVVVNKPSTSRVLKLTNTGNGPLTLSKMTLGGADAAAFILTPPTLPITLQPAAFTEVSVSLKPDSERQFTAQLVMESNDPETPSVTVPMVGMGVRQQIEVSKTVLDFGQQLLSYTSNPRNVLVTNNSDTNVTLTGVAVEGPGASQFTVLEPLAGQIVLPPGKSQKVELSFTPQDEVEVNCVLKIAFPDLTKPLEVALRGKGIPAVLSIAPSPLDFGGVRIGGKRQSPLTITNKSSDPIILVAPEELYSTGERFLYDGASLQDRELAPGMSVIVTVGYEPAEETLSETTLSFGTIKPSKPRAVDVQLKGKATKHLIFVDVDQEGLDFGFVKVGKPTEPKVITITNKSAQLQRVVVKLKDAEGAPFTLGVKELANAIAPEGTATFSVSFEPEAPGVVKNEVQVWLQGATEAEALISVKGQGTDLVGSGGGVGSGGSCGCGTTEAGSAGMLMLLALVGLGSRRRRRE